MPGYPCPHSLVSKTFRVNYQYEEQYLITIKAIFYNNQGKLVLCSNMQVI